jgi:hypothetical protein
VTRTPDPRDQALQHAVGQALEVLVYAPIGLLFKGPATLPTLVDRGRKEVASARVVGEFAVKRGKRRATKLAGQIAAQAEGIVGVFGAQPNTPARSPNVHDDGARPAPAPSPRRTTGDSTALAIPDYDSLSASQVVNRLAGLAPDELEAVGEYEAAHRGRKTILNKVSQLQA